MRLAGMLGDRSALAASLRTMRVPPQRTAFIITQARCRHESQKFYFAHIFQNDEVLMKLLIFLLKFKTLIRNSFITHFLRVLYSFNFKSAFAS